MNNIPECMQCNHADSVCIRGMPSCYYARKSESKNVTNNTQDNEELTSGDISRFIVLAIKHCPSDHHDFKEIESLVGKSLPTYKSNTLYQQRVIEAVGALYHIMPKEKETSSVKLHNSVIDDAIEAIKKVK